jgi:hypothetical protein
MHFRAEVLIVGDYKDHSPLGYGAMQYIKKKEERKKKSWWTQ